MKVYLVAYGCEPNQGGEHQVGWKLANSLNDKCSLEVITRISNQKLIENENTKNIKFTFIENKLGMKFKPKGRFSYFYYLFWQISTYNYLKNNVTKEDIVHYVTFGNIHLPQFLFLLKSKLIIGPMGGGSVVDYNLMKSSSLKLKVKSLVHKFINLTAKINPIYYLTFKKCSKIFLRTYETQKLVPTKYLDKCEVFLETGIDTSNIKNTIKKRELKTVITTARIIDTKNIDQVIDVFDKLNKLYDYKLTLKILGDGPLRKSIQKKYEETKNIEFLGKVNHQEINKYLNQADLFIFCSIKEGGSHSLFEAAMNNIPISCYDISGMEVFPKKNSAIKIKPTNDIESNTSLLTNKIYESFEKNQIDNICRNAINDLENNYSWDTIATKIKEKYI